MSQTATVDRQGRTYVSFVFMKAGTKCIRFVTGVQQRIEG